MEDVKEWRSRPLANRYSVVFLDGMSFKLRRNTIASEVVYFAAGIDQEGYREMLIFWFGAEESSTVWKEILEELKDRGVSEVLLVVTDDLSGIKEAVGEAFPKAVKKLFYLLNKEQSENWTKRRMRGFKKARDQLEEMFEERYGTNRNRHDQSTQEEIPEVGNTQ